MYPLRLHMVITMHFLPIFSFSIEPAGLIIIPGLFRLQNLKAFIFANYVMLEAFKALLPYETTDFLM